jgi:hypothetical protein
MKPLTDPQKIVINALANRENPNKYYLSGQLRLIYAALERRGLIHWISSGWILTPLGRNYITESRRNSAQTIQGGR